MEFVENRELLTGWNSVATVGDADDHIVTRRNRRQIDWRRRRRILDRVLQQVDQHLLDQNAIDADQRQCKRQVDMYRAPSQAFVHSQQRHAHHFFERLPLLMHAQCSCLDANHVEQIADHARHPTRLFDDSLSQITARRFGKRRATIDQTAGRTFDCAERRAQIVRE